MFTYKLDMFTDVSNMFVALFAMFITLFAMLTYNFAMFNYTSNMFTVLFTMFSPEPQAPMIDISALARTGVRARSRFGSVMAPPSGQRLRMRGGRSLSQVQNSRQWDVCRTSVM